ncbi:MAG: transposase [Gammaproteobacteria bacterium]|nr:transposase [Gammaproteobacteria bacterium]
MTGKHDVAAFLAPGAAAEWSGGEPAAAGETARSGAADPGVVPRAAPDPEVEARPKRRRFTADYKRRILREADAAKARGELGALLRREGLYSSALTMWRKERDTATEKAFSRPRGPKPQRNPLAAENEKLRRRNQRLEEDLRKAHIVIEVQKKVARLLRQPASGTPDKDQ